VAPSLFGADGTVLNHHRYDKVKNLHKQTRGGEECRFCKQNADGVGKAFFKRLRHGRSKRGKSLSPAPNRGAFKIINFRFVA